MKSEKEIKVVLEGDHLKVNKNDVEFFKSLRIKNFMIKIIPDITEICKSEKIPIKTVQKISEIQKIPLEVALSVVISKGKLSDETNFS